MKKPLIVVPMRSVPNHSIIFDADEKIVAVYVENSAAVEIVEAVNALTEPKEDERGR